jgi:hypothetical protein
MSTKDLSIFECGDGGELALINGDLALAETLYQQVYLALFGGNVEGSTVLNTPVNEVRHDWFGNTLYYTDTPEKQFNSNTEKVLKTTVLNSTGRILILRTVESDLQYLKNVANVEVNVVILSTYKVQITVVLTQPQNQQDVVMQIVWDGAKQELIIDKVI